MPCNVPGGIFVGMFECASKYLWICKVLKMVQGAHAFQKGRSTSGSSEGHPTWWIAQRCKVFVCVSENEPRVEILKFSEIDWSICKYIPMAI